MNGEQIKGILERMLYIIIPLGAGWIGLGTMDPATVATIVAAILAVVGIFLGWKQNTPETLAVAAAKEGDLKTVTTSNPNVAQAINKDTSTATQAKLVPPSAAPGA
jgi:hypothetical protein